MPERLTSHAEADTMAKALIDAVDYLENQGFGRDQIGSCMLGIGAGMVAVQLGDARAFEALDRVRDALMSDGATKQ